MIMPLVQTLGYRSKLKLLIRIKNWGKEPPKRFKFTYFTDGGHQTRLVCFDGKEAYFEEKKEVNGIEEIVKTPLTLCDVGVRLCIDGLFFEPGRLRVERRFFEDQEHFDADQHDQVQHGTTSIQLVDKDNKIEGGRLHGRDRSTSRRNHFRTSQKTSLHRHPRAVLKSLDGGRSKGFSWPTPEQGLVKIPGTSAKCMLLRPAELQPPMRVGL